MKEVNLGEPTSFLDHVYLVCTQRQCEISKDIVDNYRTMFESRISAGATEKLPCSELENSHGTRWLRRTDIIPWPRFLGLHSTRMRNEQRFCGPFQKYVWIQDLCRSKRKATLCRETWCRYLFMVLWCGRSCKKCVERYCEQNNPATVQSRNSMPWWPPIQRRRIRICWRIVRSMLTFFKLLVFGTYWKTSYSMVGKQTCTIDYKMDQSMWQTIMSFDILHSWYMWIQTVLLCG